MAFAAGGAGLAALGACGADGPQAPEAQPRPDVVRTAPARAARGPALCGGPLRIRVAGRVSAPMAGELSGLVLSRSRRGVLWTHNDSGDSARLLAVSASGRTVAEAPLAGAENVDWEDIALGRRGALLVGDIGDNLAARPSIVVYRVAEPAASASTSAGAAVAARYELRYPDGPRDAEALLFDPRRGAIVIVTKSFAGDARVYVASRPSAERPTTLRRRATIRLGVGQAVTAGDVSADGRTIALRTYDRAYVWRRRAGETVAAALAHRPCRADTLLGEGQGEALALTADGRAFITVPEGRRPLLRRYEASGGAPGSGG